MARADTAAPGNLRVLEVTRTTATLAWDAAPGDVFSYEISLPDRVWRIVPGTRTTKVIDNLTPGRAYRWKVAARDQDMRLSPPSNEVVVTPPAYPADTTPPGAPGAPEVTATTANTATLRWTAATDDVGVQFYEIYDGEELVGSASGLSGTVQGLRAGAQHSFSVLAVDLAWNWGPRGPSTGARTRPGTDRPVGAAHVVARSDDIPWGLVFLPDGSALFAERDTFRIHRVTRAGTKTLVGTVPEVDGLRGEDGVLGLEYRDGWLYVFHTRASDSAIVRFRYRGGLDVASRQIVLAGIPRGVNHNGGRLRFGPDGKLYATTGENQRGELAQDLKSLAGKVLRMNPDGSVPSDNPFPGSFVFSYGHRNPQGLAFDSRGRLWVAEFGHYELDEVNLVRPGGNYGWPYCEGPCGRFADPVWTFRTFDASPSGLTIVDDVLYAATTKGNRLCRIPIGGQPQQYFVGHYGRIRTVEATPSGNLWLTSSNQDGIHQPGGDDNVVVEVRLTRSGAAADAVHTGAS
ncbi:hypothetical protein Lesp02_41900 [Lentzea sp. NBRC 105346]|nr:hypothetical protein Lesp02_41900 [Lentzea sp. NBRC 105346]